MIMANAREDEYPIQPRESVLGAGYTSPEDPQDLKPENYYPGTGPDRYVRFLRDWCGMTFTPAQEQILTTVEENKYVHIEGANGFGKSYAVAGLSVAFLYCNPHTTVNATSGGYATLEDTLWAPIKTMWKQARDQGNPLPGRLIDSPPMIKTGLDDEWFFRAISPRDPRDLEGRHNDHMLFILEESDKEYVTDDHLGSADSTITEDCDRLVVLGNPPEDESNFVYDLDQSDLWETVRYSSFDSQNVHVDLGLTDRQRIPGLVELSKIKENWVEYNGEDWPDMPDREAVAQVMRWSDPDHPEFREDLSSRWYRRRAGIMPPAGAGTHRPIYVDDVQDATQRPSPDHDIDDLIPDDYAAVGIDVARKGGDSFCVMFLCSDSIYRYSWKDTDHTENYRRVCDQLEKHPNCRAPIAIDSTGEGSGIADRLVSDAHIKNHVTRFDANSEPNDDEYYNKRTESLATAGEWLSEIAIDDTQLREELFICARVVSFEERSRGKQTVFKATPKDDIKDRLGESPDALDAYCMATWIADRQQDIGEGTWATTVPTGRNSAWS